MNPEKNLDYLAAKHAQKLVEDQSKAKDLENSLTKTLGVLQENGVYACFLYLYAREKVFGHPIAAHMLHLLDDMNFGGVPSQANRASTLEFAGNLTEHLPPLLLAREALERLLIYARYGAKART
jgi:hypothetical protein